MSKNIDNLKPQDLDLVHEKIDDIKHRIESKNNCYNNCNDHYNNYYDIDPFEDIGDYDNDYCGISSIVKMILSRYMIEDFE